MGRELSKHPVLNVYPIRARWMKRALLVLILGVLVAGCAIRQPGLLPCTENVIRFGADPVGREMKPVEQELTLDERRRIYARLAAAGLDPGLAPAKPTGPDHSFITPQAREAIARWRSICRSAAWGPLTENEARILSSRRLRSGISQRHDLREK